MVETAIDDAPASHPAPATGAVEPHAWSAVVIAYESGDLLVGAVDSLLADTSAGVAEVVVVDNGSRDGSVARVCASRPGVRAVTPPRNVGYAAGANAGIALTTAPVVAVCNADLVAHAGTAAAVSYTHLTLPTILRV